MLQDFASHLFILISTRRKFLLGVSVIYSRYLKVMSEYYLLAVYFFNKSPFQMFHVKHL